MNIGKSKGPASGEERGGFWLLASCLGAVLVLLFFQSFDVSKVLFNNDGPLGTQMAKCYAPLQGFLGIWYDLYWLGLYAGSYPPTFTRVLPLFLDPRSFLSFYPLAAMFTLGLCAWFFFRRLGFGKLACVLGGLAAGLNMNYFSNACWGLASRAFCLASVFLAMAALESGNRRYALIKTILAGLALGMAVSEGADNGAILSAVVAGYAVFLSLTGSGSWAARVGKGVGQSFLMAVFAVMMAAQSLSTFKDVQVKGVVGMEQDPSLYTMSDYKDPGTLVGALQNDQNPSTKPVSSYLWSQFTPEARQALADPKSASGQPLEILLGELNRVLRTNNFYDKQRFAAAPLSAETRQLAEGGSVGSDRVKINRLLLDETFPSAMVTLREKERTKWDWATQWSLPVAETLRVIIPGVYGYRLDTPGGGAYWGRVGQQPGWETHHQGFARHSGAGEYAGALVVLIALWALANSFAGSGNAFNPAQRRAIWFWASLGLVTLVLAWGRYAPLYQFVYKLPYFSTIRNPMKFMHVVHMVLMILFAYGLQGLTARYLAQAASQLSGLQQHLATWWGKANPFEKKWNYACAAVLAASALAFLLVSNSQELVRSLANAGFEGKLGEETARFCAHEVGIFVVVLGCSMAIVLFVQCGAFAGRRALWAGLLLGAVLVIDLGRADGPWIRYDVIQEKYAMNPVLDVLKEKPYLHRVTTPSLQVPPQVAQWQNLLQQVYQVEWLQHHFLYYNISGIEVAQMSRVQEDYAAFNKALAGSLQRLWQLTNTRYILALAGFVDAFNAQLDPVKKPFRGVTLFDFAQRPGGGITAVITTNGPYALIENSSALPRAKLYTKWEVNTNDTATLKRLADPAFDPWQAVLVAEPIQAPASAGSGGANATVEYTSYTPRIIKLQTQADAPAVLLLNDRWHADWKVRVDEKPAALLRCNYVMRGVQIPPGSHKVQFLFQPKMTYLWVSLGGLGLGLLLCGLVWVFERRADTGQQSLRASSSPASKPAGKNPERGPSA